MIERKNGATGRVRHDKELTEMGILRHQAKHKATKEKAAGNDKTKD